MQMSYLYASDFPFKTFCKLAQHVETIRKNVWEKSNNAYSLSIRVQTTTKHMSIWFFTTISTPKKVFFFFFRARAEKVIARHVDASNNNNNNNYVWTLIDNGLVIFDWFVPSMRMQVILDSSFRSPGLSPYMGREERRVRDWTKRSEVRAQWTRAKYFPVRPDLTQSTSILYDHRAFLFFLSFFLIFGNQIRNVHLRHSFWSKSRDLHSNKVVLVRISPALLIKSPYEGRTRS